MFGKTFNLGPYSITSRVRDLGVSLLEDCPGSQVIRIEGPRSTHQGKLRHPFIVDYLAADERQ
jgi:hypothetical protein